MSGSLNTRSNIYRAISAYFFLLLNSKRHLSPYKEKNEGRGRRGGCAISMNVLFSGEQTTGLRYCDLIKMFLFQTTLGTHQELGNQTCYNIPSGQLLTSGERGYSLDNGQIVNHSTAKQQIKQTKLENLSHLVHNTTIHSIVCRRFNTPFFMQSLIQPPLFFYFFSLFIAMLTQ